MEGVGLKVTNKGRGVIGVGGAWRHSVICTDEVDAAVVFGVRGAGRVWELGHGTCNLVQVWSVMLRRDKSGASVLLTSTRSRNVK